MTNNLMKGIIDMHVHSNPDIRIRAYDDFQLMEAGIRVGARAIVIKTHQGTTMDRAYLCNEHNRIVHNNTNDFTMFGSITLNRQVGGLNPVATEVALKLGAKVVWLPTQSARHHLRMNKKAEENVVDVTKNGELVPEMEDILSLVKQYDAILGTAHIAPEESFLVVDKAKRMGIDKVVVTHPEWWLVGMSHDDQERIVKEYDVFLERCYAQPMGGGAYKSNLPDTLDLINRIGNKNIMISTDGGQTENPNWELALDEYVTYMQNHGVSDEDLYHMTHTIQRQLLNIE